MNKKQLLKKARKIGTDITELINEFRNSSGEEVEHNEEYYSEFFAGLVVFLSTSGGKVVIEYDDDPSFQILEGQVTVVDGIHYPFEDDRIHDNFEVTETKFVKKGELERRYTVSTDLITFLEYCMTSPIKGSAITREVGEFDGGV